MVAANDDVGYGGDVHYADDCGSCYCYGEILRVDGYCGYVHGGGHCHDGHHGDARHVVRVVAAFSEAVHIVYTYFSLLSWLHHILKQRCKLSETHKLCRHIKFTFPSVA